MKTLLNKWFLFQKEPPTDGPLWQKICYWLWNGAILLGGSAAMGVVTLLFAYGVYPNEVFPAYIENRELLMLNILPVVWFVFFLYAVFGRTWIAFGLGGASALGLTLGNFFKLLFRDDPLYFEDLLILREAGEMAGGYALFIDRRIALAVLCVVAGTAVLFFFARGRIKTLKCRLALLLAALVSGGILLNVCLDTGRYEAVKNYDYLNPWSPTQNYIAHGFLYPFLHSIGEVLDTAPEGYHKRDAQQLLSAYEDTDIPADKKVNLITIMREAYVDFSAFDVAGLDSDCYDSYHDLLDESYSGTLLTNIFAGGTIDTERCFLTGNYSLKNFRGNANSYLWYLRDQGYTVEGSHPYYQWFYNRQNVNSYLGFERYRFFENDFDRLTRAYYPEDKFLFPEIYSDYLAGKESGKPYFSFSLNVQSHGPYETGSYNGEHEYLTGDYTDACKNAVNNYMNAIMDSDKELMALVDKLRADKDPVVLVVFNDHLPWMGDGNEFYREMGINADVTGNDEASFRTRYQTDYLIWANDAAKKTLGSDFRGVGPTVSPCYLMNLVFDLCGWEGPAFMQAMDDMREVFPVVTTRGFYVVDDTFTDAIPEERRELFDEFLWLNHYWRNEFLY